MYSWVIRRRVFGLYGELKLIKVELEADGGAAVKDLKVRDRLQELSADDAPRPPR